MRSARFGLPDDDPRQVESVSFVDGTYERGVFVDTVFPSASAEGRGRSYPKQPADCVKV